MLTHLTTVTFKYERVESTGTLSPAIRKIVRDQSRVRVMKSIVRFKIGEKSTGKTGGELDVGTFYSLLERRMEILFSFSFFLVGSLKIVSLKRHEVMLKTKLKDKMIPPSLN